MYLLSWILSNITVSTIFVYTENDSSQRSLGRVGSKRLDTNRFSQFNKSLDEIDPVILDTKKPAASAAKKTANTNRLDRSRFARFEMNNQTNGSETQPPPRKRNFVINKSANKKRFGSDVSITIYHFAPPMTIDHDCILVKCSQCCQKKVAKPRHKYLSNRGARSKPIESRFS